MDTADWKNFLLEYKWMPTRQLVERFGIKKHDVDNFRRKSEVRSVLAPWRISLDQSPERLRKILQSAWKYYLTHAMPIDFKASTASWVPELLAVKNISKSSFSFLTNSKYLTVACPDEFKDFRKHGYTNVALGVYEFWPGSAFLRPMGVLPYMFQQTHRDALSQTDAISMIEHVYLNFLSREGGMSPQEQLRQTQERMYVRYREAGFITSTELSRFGVPGNFYSQQGGLKSILKELHHKYGVELGYVDKGDSTWSSKKFRQQCPERNFDSCEYCGLSPVELHHLLPHRDYQSLVYESENVVPLCANVHRRITRGLWTEQERCAYNDALKLWLRSSAKECRRDMFRSVMEHIHSEVYGSSFMRGGQE